MFPRTNQSQSYLRFRQTTLSSNRRPDLKDLGKNDRHFLKDRIEIMFHLLRDHSSQSMASIRIVLIVPLILAVPGGARAADATVLLGPMTVNGSRPAVGVAIGHAPSVAGFEIEYLSTLGGETASHSAAGGIFGNLIVQPVVVGRLQFYGIAGFGVWGETFADDTGTGAVGTKDVGGGVKIRLADRLRLRLDYRVFLLGAPDDASRLPSTTRPQRISVGLHVAF